MSNKKICDVLIIGELTNVDLLFAEHLSRKGLKCCVLRRSSKKNEDELKRTITGFPPYHEHFQEESIIYYRSSFEFLKIASRSRLIVSFTGSLIVALRILWFLRNFLPIPPVINISTGSDIAEFSVEKSFLGILYRQYLKFVNLNFCLPCPHVIKNLFFLKVPNVIFIRFPYYIMECTEESFGTNSVSKSLMFFHASNLDWKVMDKGSHRFSSKGNDRFLRSFARAVRNGLDAYCAILDRGPDKEVARNLIRELGVEDKFIWKPHLTRKELFDEFRKADVVVDQFDVGGLGGIAVEAMSMGKPVLIYLQENCQKILFAEPPPVLNCQTEEEIYEKIMKCEDRAYLRKLGMQAKEWTLKYYDWDNESLNQFLFYYTLLTGHKVINYGWERNLYIGR